MASEPRPISDRGDTPAGYIGLTREFAERRARERGWSTVRSLAPGTVITMEYLTGRLNFEIVDDHVHRCWMGLGESIQ